MATMYQENDGDLANLDGRTVAVIGYGNQGRAHALNLRDSGVDITVGQRPGASFDRAVADGFEPVPAAEVAEFERALAAYQAEKGIAVAPDQALE